MDINELRRAMEKAFYLGQQYWAQVDSESPKEWKKGDVTKEQFKKLLEDTIRYFE
jgi:hypothetical protein